MKPELRKTARAQKHDNLDRLFQDSFGSFLPWSSESEKRHPFRARDDSYPFCCRAALGKQANFATVAAIILLCLLQLGGTAFGAESSDTIPAAKGSIKIHPVNHATLALAYENTTIYVDPVGGGKKFESLPKPDLILLTDIHGDHLNAETLQAVTTEKTRFVCPPAVAEQLPAVLRARATVLVNGQKDNVAGVQIEAIAAYNLNPDRQKFHAKGRGNGYVIMLGEKRIYISGDSEDIPEMRSLKGIDLAFLCMNLPYTMTVDQAAEAVKAFRPKVVYPYHCRGSNLETFKSLLAKEAGIEVRIRDWYAK